jgi:polyphosphate kinase
MGRGHSSLIDRDLSWLEFNRRVLDEAKDPAIPLLERVTFLAIFSSNLDEFLTVRVAGLKRQNRSNGLTVDSHGREPILTVLARRVHELAEEQHLCFLDTILPQLRAEGIHLLRPEEASREQQQFLEEYFERTLYPIVTPLAIDPGHPFPYLANRAICLIVSLRPKMISPLPHTEHTIIHLPAQVVPRFIQLPTRKGQYAFVLLEEVLSHYLPRLYPNVEILPVHTIRVTRDAEFGLIRRRNEDLLTTVEKGIRERRMGDAVRLQYDPDLPEKFLSQLIEELELSPDDLYPAKGFTAFTDLLQLYSAVNLPRRTRRWHVDAPGPRRICLRLRHRTGSPDQRTDIDSQTANHQVPRQHPRHQ